MKTEPRDISRYKPQQCLGRDIVGEVWKARDTNSQQSVLLKFYRTHLSDDDDVLTHYLHTVEQIASLHHPNIVHIHDVQVLASSNDGHTPSMICLATEYIEGETLADYIRDTSAVGKMSPRTEIVYLFASIALAIDTAHQHGIIHGNLKPTNILLKRNPDALGRVGIPMLTDFGSTKLLPNKYGSRMPFYLAPEQIKDAKTERSSDIYALGAILYELYTGVPPFRGSRPIAVMMQHISAQPTSPDLVNPSVSPALTQVILRSLAKDPQERFPNATSLVVALAQALNVDIPENMRRSGFLEVGTESSVPPSTPTVRSAGTKSRLQAQSSTLWLRNGVDKHSSTTKRKSKGNLLLITIIAALVLVLSASFGTLLLRMAGGTTSSTLGGGHAFFINSGQLNGNNNQGLNDELQIELSHIPDPAPGKSYYAWLLGDVNNTEAAPILLGRLTVEQGNMHFLYPGNRQHVNLLGIASRFLINEDDTHNPSSDPLLDQSTWRYYAAIPQTPDPADKLHFSMLDHLRHLIVESPELAIRGLHGGLAFWFVRDTATISDLANGLADDWQKKDTHTIRDQVIRILDYLDSSPAVKADVPSGTPVLANTQVALLGPVPQNADPPGYVYQDESPPGYTYLIQLHMNGAILSPQTTSQQHQTAIQINGGLDNVRNLLTHVYQDARQLVRMTNDEILQPAALTLLDDMATQAQYAYTGQSNPSTGTSQGGAIWIYNNLQRLASFEVTPYSQPKP
ncbi:MAG TPA: serine/threonine-protein kinase [Ktedonobacteraceae bacterium]|nr:serine/threonine-protein kinase [Ktedonobacteraceae bacterium]